jgi:hypothetical protein
METIITPVQRLDATTGARWMTVNLQPDVAGPMHRNRALLVDATKGYNRVPPTQRLEDPIKQSMKTQVDNRALCGSTAIDNKKYYETVIDSSIATELKLPRQDGSTQAYKYGSFKPPNGALITTISDVSHSHAI